MSTGIEIPKAPHRLDLGETRLPRSYSLLEIDARGDVEVETIDVLDVSDWKSRLTVTRSLGDEWLRSRRGAWYASVEIETSIAEVAFHKRRFFEEGRIASKLPSTM